MKMRNRKTSGIIGIILGCIMVASLVPMVLANSGVLQPGSTDYVFPLHITKKSRIWLEIPIAIRTVFA